MDPHKTFVTGFAVGALTGITGTLVVQSSIQKNNFVRYTANEAGYINNAPPGEHCKNCVHFRNQDIEDLSCMIVNTKISSNGVCNFVVSNSSK
jgi:hypothetical protein